VVKTAQKGGTGCRTPCVGPLNLLQDPWPGSSLTIHKVEGLSVGIFLMVIRDLALWPKKRSAVKRLITRPSDKGGATTRRAKSYDLNGTEMEQRKS